MRTEMISVIVPVYNIREYISTCLDSLLSQTYNEIEIICVDDGSFDGSAEVLDSYSKEHTKIRVIHKRNGGVTSARLTGVVAASGEWIGFVDGDDFIEPDTYRRLMINARKYKAEISHCGYQMVFSDRVDYYYNTGTLRVQNNREAVKDLLSEKIEPGVWNKLYQRKLFNRLIDEAIIDTSIKYNEDYLMNFYLFQQAQISVFEDFCPYHYRIRVGSAAMSQINRYKFLDPIKVRKTLLKETKEDNELNTLCMQELARTLIRIATKNMKDYQQDVRYVIFSARKELRSYSKSYMKRAGFSNVMILKTYTAAKLPDIYRFFHHIYGEITGINHKYDIKRPK